MIKSLLVLQLVVVQTHTMVHQCCNCSDSPSIYTMASLTDVKAGGSQYVRAGWTDSFVRGGMFDDQNGMSLEYDGQALYAVRRSSTLQLAGVKARESSYRRSKHLL